MNAFGRGSPFGELRREWQLLRSECPQFVMDEEGRLNLFIDNEEIKLGHFLSKSAREWLVQYLKFWRTQGKAV